MAKKPLFVFGIMVFAGAFSAGFRPWRLTYAVLIGAPVYCALYAIWQIRKNRRYAARVIFITAVASALPIIAYNFCAGVWGERLLKYGELDGATIGAVIKITSPAERSGNNLRFEALPLYVDGHKAPGGGVRIPDKILLSLRDDDTDDLRTRLAYGTVVRVNGRLAKPARQQNEYLFDYQKYLFSRGIVATIYAVPESIYIVSEPDTFFGAPVHPIGVGIALRNRIEGTFRRCLPPGEAVLLCAILLGKTDELDDDTRGIFAAAGLLHMMAVSGLHIVILTNLATVLAKKAGAGINAARLISLCIICVFVFIAGFSASIVRAAIAYILAVLSGLAGKSYDPYGASGLAVLLLLLYNPMQVFGAGFILSFSSVVSINALSKGIREQVGKIRIPRLFNSGGRIPPMLSDSVCISLAVCAGCYPVQATLFHHYPALSVLSNLLCAPLIFGTMAAGLLTAVTGLIAPTLAPLPAYAAVNFLWAIERVAKTASGIPNAYVRTGGFGPLSFLAYYTALAVICGLVRMYGITEEGKRERFFYAVSALAAAALFVILTRGLLFNGVGPDEMEVVFLDTGNSNAAYINIAGRYHAVVDAGGTVSFSGSDRAGPPGGRAPETRLYGYLTGRGVKAIDLAIATHGDADHIQGFWSVLEGVPVRRLMIAYNADEQLEELAAYARAKGVEIVRSGTGDAVRLGNRSVVETLWPAEVGSDPELYVNKLSPNDISLVVRFVFGEMKVLFCGDIGIAVENDVILHAGADGLDAGIMSVPHHGSKYSSGAAFLETIAPGAAIAGVGANNYGHPSPDAVARYDDAGAVFYRTDRNGMISVLCRSDGTYRIKCFNDADNLPAWQRK